MCIGIPMQVIRADADADGRGDFALCGEAAPGERVDMRLIGAQPVGTWILNFNGAARRVLDADEAAQIRDALGALDAALRGDVAGIDALFADLVNREPQLPDHLRPAPHHTR